MEAKKGICEDCGYWPNEGKRQTACHRYPQSVVTGPTYWCGEFVNRTPTESRNVANKLESKASKKSAMDAYTPPVTQTE